MSFNKCFFAILRVGIALAMVLSMAIPVMAGAITGIAVTPVDDTAGATTDYSITFTPATGEAANVTVDFSAFGTAGNDMDLTGVSTNINDYSFTGFSVNATGVSVNNTTKIIVFTGGNTTTSVHTITNTTPGTGLRITNAQDAETQNVTISTLSDSGTFPLTINPGAIDHYSVSAISSPQVAGVPFGVTIQAQDVYNNNITTGADASENITITFGKADAAATPTSNSTASGTATMNMTMTVPQSDQNITFTGDTSAKTGTSGNFTVNPAPEYVDGGGGGINIKTISPPGITYVFDVVTTKGEFTEDVTAKSEDGLVELTINEGTVGLGLTEKGEFLEKIIIDEMEDPPTPPKDSEVIGLTYNLGPDGATFDPPITLTFTYDPDEVPEDIREEDLVIAHYDEAADEWVECDSECDPEAHSIKALVSHFTPVAVIGRVVPAPPPPLPAAFSISSLSIQPGKVQPEEAVTIAVSVANTGGKEGSYIVILKINEVKEAEKKVTVAAGSTQDVSFTVTKVEAGSYSIVVDGLSGSFVVVAPPPPIPPPPPVPVAEPPMNWPLIGGAIAAGLVVGGVITFFLVVRRRKH